jgi:flagellar basal body-associated protein FliL
VKRKEKISLIYTRNVFVTNASPLQLTKYQTNVIRDIIRLECEEQTENQLNGYHMVTIHIHIHTHIHTQSIQSSVTNIFITSAFT